MDSRKNGAGERIRRAGVEMQTCRAICGRRREGGGWAELRELRCRIHCPRTQAAGGEAAGGAGSPRGSATPWGWMGDINDGGAVCVPTAGFTLSFGRSQHNTVKELSANKINK